MTEMMSGVRMMPSWIVPGGLRGDAPEGCWSGQGVLR